MDRLLAFLRRIFGMQDGEAGNHSQNKHDEKMEPNEVQKVEEKQHPYENVTLNKENVDIASSNEIQGNHSQNKHDEKKEPNEVQKEKMLTEENEYYLRIILLLCGGCLYVTKRFLEQELKNRDEKLDNLLKRKEKKLRHELHKKQVERLFPNDGFDKTDIDTWDIQMILCVLVHVLNEPDSKEKKLIRELKKYRNDIIAHRATTTLNKKDFDTLQSDIQDTMKHLASKCSSSVQKDCEMYISSSLTGPLDISLAEKYLQELAESEEKVQEIIDKFKSLKRRISRSDVTTWHELNEIHCDLKELKSYFKTASMELENQIGVSNEGLNQMEDSLASKFRAHYQKEDPGVRKSVVPRELAKSGQSTSIPQTPKIEKKTSLSPESKSVKDQKPFVETPSKSPESKSVKEQKPFVETPSKSPESKSVKEQKPFVETPSKSPESKSVKEEKPFVETPSKSPERKYVKDQEPFVETPSIGHIRNRRDNIYSRDIVAAIDIGTALSGCAFYCTNRLYIPNWWSAASMQGSQKTPTCILFNSNKEFHSFGFEAEDKYASLPEENNDYMKWFFFKHFKMQLYENMPVKRFVTVDGKEMDAIEVMSATISFFQKKVLEVIRSFIWVDDFMKFQQQIRWVLTVPAIWTDSAKQFMRKAAIRAGLQTDKLRIALEPEVAGIYCITEGLYGTQSILATFGHKYIVVDMGGGTVDITPLAFEHHDGFKVLHKPSGCACGSTKVDIAFFKLIEDLLGRDFFSKYSTENREDHIDFQRNFEWKKLAISNETTDDIMLRIPMLHRYQTEMGDVNEAIKKSAYREAISYSRLKLRISSDTLKSFFKPCSDEIIQHIDDVLRTVSDEGIKAIILTGGFSESSLMQNSIATAFPNLKVLVPEHPIEAVLRGAVLYGLTPDIIISREIKYTYGIEISPLFDATKHDESRRVVICGKERCKNVFRKFVGIGEKVSNGTTVCQEHSTIVPYQEEVFFEIFCSETSHPMYTDETGVSFLGTLQVSIPKRETSDFNVKFGFGGTEISVTTVDLKTKQEHSCKVDFLG